MGMLYKPDGTFLRRIKNEYRWLVYNRKRISSIRITRVSQARAHTDNVDAELIATLDTSDYLVWHYGDYYLARHMAERFATEIVIIDERDGEILADLWLNLQQAKSNVIDSANKGAHDLGPWLGDDSTTPSLDIEIRCKRCNRQWRLHAHTPYGQRTRYNTVVVGGYRVCTTKSSTAWKFTGNV